MSEPASPGLQAQTFELAPAPPVRALGIGAGLSAVGAVLVVLWNVRSWPLVVAIVGVILLLLAIALGLAAVLLGRRLRTRLRLYSQGLTVERAGSSRTVLWSEVSEAKLHGPRLILVPREDREGDVEVLCPDRRAQPVFLAAVRAVRARLDTDRGYGSTP